MNETIIHAVQVRFVNDVDPIAVRNLKRTLAIVPPAHRAALRRIDVVPPRNLGHGPNYAGGGSGVGYPRLSELCFSRSHRRQNFPINLTLLHEIGHVLETRFRCLRHLAREHPQHFRVLDAIPIPSSGRTHGPSEHYAIAYQKVIAGTATQEVKDAVYASRAFAGAP